MPAPRTAVIIPYRDRLTNLTITWQVLTTLHKIDPRHIYVAEQLGRSPFVRGMLFNAAVRQIAPDYDQIVLHDADMVPIDWDLRETDKTTHLFDWCNLFLETHQRPIAYDGYIGGSTLIPTREFDYINGFSNAYAGWGGEDDDLRVRTEKYGKGWTRRPGKMLHLPHPPQSRTNFDANMNLFRQMENGQSDNSDGYRTCNLLPQRTTWFNTSILFQFYV